MAEALFNKKYGPAHKATSGGTKVFSKEGESRDGQKLRDLPAAAEVIEALCEFGIDAQDFLRTQITPDMLKGPDKIVVMAEPHTIPDYLTAAPNTIYWEVEDPKGLSLEDTKRIRDEIAKRIDTLMSEQE